MPGAMVAACRCRPAVAQSSFWEGLLLSVAVLVFHYAASGVSAAEVVISSQDGEDDEYIAPSCPAGPSGDACRGDTDLLGSGPSLSTFEWKAVEGCAIPAGSDIGEPRQLTVEEAKQHCEAEERCVAFTFEGNDPLGPLSGLPIWVHLKEKFDCIPAEWIGYRKMPRRGPGASTVAAPAPPPAPPPAHDVAPRRTGDDEDEGKGVALCLVGQVRMLPTTGGALLQNFLEVLEPDVFMYGPREPGGDPFVPDDIREYIAAERWEDEDIRTQLYAETGNAGRTIDLEYMEVQGNWFGNQCLRPALPDSRPGSAICFYYNQHKCLEMVRDHEDSRGYPYKWVAMSRTDFRWLAPHPPLDLLDVDAVWIPSGSDWEGGLNDRHAVIPRKYLEDYMSAWKLITEAKAKDVMLETLGPMKVMGYPGPNTECFLRARLQYYNVPIERFPSVAYLTCTQRVKSRWTQCSGTPGDAPGWLYKEEMEHATRIAKCVKSSWTRKKMEDCNEDITHLYRPTR